MANDGPAPDRAKQPAGAAVAGITCPEAPAA
jgi:hypothetical protein